MKFVEKQKIQGIFFLTVRKRANRPLEIKHTEIGYTDVHTQGSKIYYITLFDDFTYFTRVFLI